MSDTPDIRQPAPITTDTFRSFVERAALLSLRGALSEEEAKRIAGQTALGFFTAMRTAKNPQDIVNCTRESILSAIATSVSTRLVVGTPNAPAYLVPQRPRAGAQSELQFRINHRGWAILFLRAGFVLDPVPVGTEDALTLVNGEVRHTQNPDSLPATWDDLKGVVVYATHIESRLRLASWVPKAVIQQRRDKSRDGGIWNQWPVEMSMGAAIRYCVARGKLPIDSMAIQTALDAEPRVVDAESEVVERPARPVTARSALGLSDPTPALPDHGDQPDPLAGARPQEREAVPVQSEVVEQPRQARKPPTPADVGKAESAVLASGGTASVQAARNMAGLDYEIPVDEMSQEQLVSYRAALATV